MSSLVWDIMTSQMWGIMYEMKIPKSLLRIGKSEANILNCEAWWVL